MRTLHAPSHFSYDGNMEFGRIVVNTGRARRVVRNGKSWLVAPLTTIVPGVLPGSKGPLLYPHVEVRRSTPAWNGIPITVYHPMATNGQHVSAKSPGILARQGIGFLRNSKWRGKLVHDGWFDEVKTNAVDRRVVRALLTGQPMEVSTGLFTDNVPAQGTYNGRGYQFIARRYVPDHLAVLPDQVGACSVQDGCGLNVNQRTRIANGVRKQDRSGFESVGDRAMERPKIGAKVVSETHGSGTVDERGPNHTWVKLDKDGSVVKVPHSDLKRDEIGRFASNVRSPDKEGCGDGG